MDLLQRSVTAGVFIVCILLLRRLAFHKLPKRMFAVLWELAVLRLILPFSYQVRYTPVREWAIPVLFWREADMEPSMVKEEVQGLLDFFFRNRELVYFLGVILTAMFFLIGYVRIHWQFREAIPVNSMNDIIVESDFQKLTRGVRIKILDRIATPVTYGFFRPIIILPKSMDFSDRDMISYVLRHEMVHVRWGDNLWKFLSMAALCLHWFNPLVLVMLLFLNKDMEIACDASVVSTMEENDRRKYAMTLVMLAENMQYITNLSGFGKSAVSERIKEIMNYKKVSKIGSLCAALVLLGGTAVFVSVKEEEKGVEVAPMSAMIVVGEEAADISFEEKANATVFFEEGISEERIDEIGNELLATQGVEGIGYTSADEAWGVFAEKYLDEEIKVSFKENPLKDSANYEVYLSDKSEEVIQAIEKIDGVRKVNVR